MKTTRDFTPNGDRYAFDFGACSINEGWAQLDTDSDAWYYGNWAHPHKFMIVSYVEGDITIQKADNGEEFAQAIREFASWQSENDHFKGIDPGLGPDIKGAFIELGLEDLLH